jgi:hypothetical protein
MDNSNAHDMGMQDMLMLKEYLFFLLLWTTLMHMTSRCKTSWVCKITCFPYFMDNSNAHDMGMQDIGMLKDY